jgi:hypothetical protein
MNNKERPRSGGLQSAVFSPTVRFSVLKQAPCCAEQSAQQVRAPFSDTATATEEFGVASSLRETIANMRFGQGDVGAVERTIGVHILAEVGAGDRLTNLRFYQRNVGCINQLVPIHIAN